MCPGGCTHCSPQVVTEEKIAQAKEFVLAHMGDAKNFNEEGWRYILEKHGGKLPLVIRAVPEGTCMPTSNVLFTMENTDPVRPRYMAAEYRARMCSPTHAAGRLTALPIAVVLGVLLADELHGDTPRPGLASNDSRDQFSRAKEGHRC